MAGHQPCPRTGRQRSPAQGAYPSCWITAAGHQQCPLCPSCQPLTHSCPGTGSLSPAHSPWLLLPEHSDSSAPHAGESYNEEIWDFPLRVKCPLVPGQCQLPGLPMSGITSGGGKGSSCSRVQHSQTIPCPHPGCALMSSHSSDQCSRPHHREAMWC